MKVKLHLLCIPLIFFMILSGQIAYYAIILTSLLWHEAGHLLVAMLCGVKIKSCVISPYGGEIEFENPAAVQTSSLLWIALGVTNRHNTGDWPCFFHARVNCNTIN
ncbi:hypothetical protein LSPH24S_01348 [Lysinibacillus sphaericus]